MAVEPAVSATSRPSGLLSGEPAPATSMPWSRSTPVPSAPEWRRARAWLEPLCRSDEAVIAVGELNGVPVATGYALQCDGEAGPKRLPRWDRSAPSRSPTGGRGRIVDMASSPRLRGGRQVRSSADRLRQRCACLREARFEEFNGIGRLPRAVKWASEAAVTAAPRCEASPGSLGRAHAPKAGSSSTATLEGAPSSRFRKSMFKLCSAG